MSQRPDRFPFYRMSALRQAAVLTAVFVSILLAAGAFALNELERDFNRRVERDLQGRFNEIATEIARSGFDKQRMPDTGLETVRFLPKGQRSSLPDFRKTGFFDKIEQNGKRQERGDWRYLGGPVAGGQLIVGTNLGRRDDFFSSVLRALVIAGVASTLAAGGLGLAFGLRNQRRISAISGTLDKVAGGDLSARINTTRDKDDLDALAQRIDETTARLDVLLRQTRDFSANIAHDLKTPLARLRLRLETALTAETESGESLAEIGAALEQTDKIISIFDAFQRIAKLESGATKADFVTLDLVTIAQEVIDIYGAVIEDSNRVLTAELNGPAVVQGDRVLLIQMLANMIENALRHTPQGTQLRLIAQPGELGLADSGPGIPENERSKVTQPLYRLEKSRTTEGSGLGLSLVKTIAELHGAALVLSPDPKTGTGLYIRARFETTKT